MSDPPVPVSGKLFLDTNVIVYALDGADKLKQARCRDIMSSAAREHRGVVSTQVLQELYVVATRKLGIDPRDAKEIVASLANFETVIVTPPLIAEAIDCSVLARISFWDSLIVTAAESASCAAVVTEDLPKGQLVRGVRVASPF
jgi:predicted nucleic acid-binding protein